MIGDSSSNHLLVLSLLCFFGIVLAIAGYHFQTLFCDVHGWSHRLAGGLHLSWLVIGVLAIHRQGSNDSPFYALGYDIILGCLGVTATLTAARDFPHRYVSNSEGQSGTLSVKAMVTQNEMMEHAFYQFLNLWQALYLHFNMMVANNRNNTSLSQTKTMRSLALFVVTAPWLLRDRFPVHSFSHNWSKTPADQRTAQETLLYRIKKAQYLFYKHVILHGINLTVFLASSSSNSPAATSLVTTIPWRLFWICLNASYVMEFFLQSLVKRRIILQSTMLLLNRMLMAISSVAAVRSIFFIVRWDLCLASCAFNLLHRKHDLLNTLLIAYFALITTTAVSSTET